ncbi:uncharacterized protein N7483_006168 [Penicillium malachiteum]|uniref:uncharacterized protein n=1 Tax=Penicillium malachiteum TaxID=1324776 RepID=UPI002548E617|nr:uncharacterized protein N7483_006168 [Penicillium malachiteum]KAJ5731660.1 hypothetical protein N7483_006168 [Penicillium malachiteum]
MGIVASKNAATRILTASNEALELLESNNVDTARAHLLAVVENPETIPANDFMEIYKLPPTALTIWQEIRDMIPEAVPGQPQAVATQATLLRDDQESREYGGEILKLKVARLISAMGILKVSLPCGRFAIASFFGATL